MQIRLIRSAALHTTNSRRISRLLRSWRLSAHCFLTVPLYPSTPPCNLCFAVPYQGLSALGHPFADGLQAMTGRPAQPSCGTADM